MSNDKTILSTDYVELETGNNRYWIGVSHPLYDSTYFTGETPGELIAEIDKLIGELQQARAKLEAECGK